LRRIDQFNRFWGNNWIIGRQLIPILSDWGREEKGVVVDYGCGESPFRFCFPHARKYLRFDIKLNDNGVIPVDGNGIPCADNSVDCLLLFQVLGDIPDLKEFFNEVCRVLKSNGTFLIFETVSYPEHEFPNDFYRIMPSGINWLAEQTGFKIVEMIKLGGLFSRFAQLWNIFIMGRLRNLPIIGFIAIFGIALVNLAACLLDKLFPHQLLGTDYVAKLRK